MSLPPVFADTESDSSDDFMLFDEPAPSGNIDVIVTPEVTPPPSSTAGDDKPTQPSAEGLALKYRPRRFGDLVGQAHVSAVLRRAGVTIPPPQQVLFSGGSGLGKTTVARIFAAALNCLNRASDGDACGVCDNCLDILDPRRWHPDVIELDAASHGGKEEIKEIASRALTAPLRSQYKIYIVDEVHGISRAGGEAFLKLLEEPPTHVIFLLATTDPGKMLKTNRGRCQEFELTMPSAAELQGNLERIAQAEGWELPEWAATMVVDATDPDLGVRGTVMTLAKLSGQLQAHEVLTPDTVSSVLNMVSAAGLGILVAAIEAGDRAGALTALDSARLAASDAAVREALLSWARSIVLAASDPTALTLALWRLETLLCAPAGMLWTDVCVTRLTSPELAGPEALAAQVAKAETTISLLNEAVVDAKDTASRLTQLPAPAAPASVPEPDPMPGPAPETDPAPEDSTSQPEPTPADDASGDHATTGFVSPMPDPDPAQRLSSPPPIDSAPTPEASTAQPEPDPWFDSPDAVETTPTRGGRRARPDARQRPSRAKPDKAPAAKSGAKKAPAKKTAPKQAAPKHTEPPPPKEPARSSVQRAPEPPPGGPQAREQLMRLVTIRSPLAGEVLTACVMRIDGTTLVVSVPVSRAGDARQSEVQETVKQAASSLGWASVTWRKHAD